MNKNCGLAFDIPPGWVEVSSDTVADYNARIHTVESTDGILCIAVFNPDTPHVTFDYPYLVFYSVPLSVTGLNRQIRKDELVEYIDHLTGSNRIEHLDRILTKDARDLFISAKHGVPILDKDHMRYFITTEAVVQNTGTILGHKLVVFGKLSLGVLEFYGPKSILAEYSNVIDSVFGSFQFHDSFKYEEVPELAQLPNDIIDRGHPDNLYNYILRSYMTIEINGYDGLPFGTYKNTVENDLESRVAFQSIKNGILYSVDEHHSYDLATSLTFINDREFVAARSFVLADNLDPQFDYNDFTQSIKGIIAKEHGAPWEHVNDPKSDGYYISWKTKDYYLNISYTPRKWSRGSIVPIDLSVYWTVGTTDQAFQSEMRSQHGF